LVEAALYVSGRPLGLGTLASILEARDKSKILSIAQDLVEKYKIYNGALEVREVKKILISLTKLENRSLKPIVNW
jgi:chromosome segregation and condensation protein ScpB